MTKMKKIIVFTVFLSNMDYHFFPLFHLSTVIKKIKREREKKKRNLLNPNSEPQSHGGNDRR